MSLYNESLISGNNPLTILQGINSFADGMAFTVISFAIYIALMLAIYSKDEDVGQSLSISSFSMTILSTLLWFGSLVPIYIPFVFLSLMVCGIVIQMFTK